MNSLFYSICFLFLLVMGDMQAQPDEVIRTKEQNNKWLWDLEMLPLKAQAEKIQKRILTDTSDYKQDAFAITGQAPSGKRPLYIMDNIVIGICKETSTASLKELSAMINNTISIKILEEAQGTPVYGIKATGGVILLETTNKKTEDKLKQLKLTGTGCN